MIQLYQIHKLEGKNYSYSPFCVKMELYLKAMNLSYENHFSLEFNKSPTGKIPFIETKGRKYSDSNLIIEFLEKENAFSLDSHLTQQQKAISLAFIRLCEDSLYWVGVYTRWVDGDNKIWKKDFIKTSGLPKLLASIIYPIAKRNMQRQVKSTGLTLLSKNEIYSRAEADLKSMSDYLDAKEYFFNNQLSLVDITVFSFLVMIFDGSCGKRAQNFVQDLNLDKFMQNMQRKFIY